MNSGQVEKGGKMYGCHVDLFECEPDGCVLDYGVPHECIYGTLPSGNVRRSKWTCQHWKQVKGEPK